MSREPLGHPHLLSSALLASPDLSCSQFTSSTSLPLSPLDHSEFVFLPVEDLLPAPFYSYFYRSFGLFVFHICLNFYPFITTDLRKHKVQTTMQSILLKIKVLFSIPLLPTKTVPANGIHHHSPVLGHSNETFLNVL